MPANGIRFEEEFVSKVNVDYRDRLGIRRVAITGAAARHYGNSQGLEVARGYVGEASPPLPTREFAVERL